MPQTRSVCNRRIKIAKMSTVSLASCADAGGENGQVIPAVYDFDFSDIDGEYVPVITDSLGSGCAHLGLRMQLETA